MCGGNRGSLPVSTATRGLSPRVRGKPGADVRDYVGQGSIPACAGETYSRKHGAGHKQVYPRVCGGNLTSAGSRGCCIGLSPRVRGKPALLGLLPKFQGSIPACAGETDVGCQRRGAYPVYPRVCGGNIANLGNQAADTGLSPRVRGKPARDGHMRYAERSIPACAGETCPGPRRPT